MSSEASTELARARRDLPHGASSSTLQPWQFFVLGGMLVAMAALYVTRGSEPRHVIFVTLAIGSAALVALAVYRAVLPLLGAELVTHAEMLGGRTRAALEREKMLVLRAIKELEFDSAMGKVSHSDFQDMTRRLRARAVRLMHQLDSGAVYRERIEHEIAARLDGLPPPTREPRAMMSGTCVGCGTANDADARFCKHCGAKLA